MRFRSEVLGRTGVLSAETLSGKYHGSSFFAKTRVFLAAVGIFAVFGQAVFDRAALGGLRFMRFCHKLFATKEAMLASSFMPRFLTLQGTKR
jgi:hypothetical protein